MRMAPFFQLKPLRTYSPYANVAEIRQLSLTSKGNNTSLKKPRQTTASEERRIQKGKRAKGEKGKWEMENGVQTGVSFPQRSLHACELLNWVRRLL